MKKILWISHISWMNSEGVYFPSANYPGVVSGSAFQQSIIEALEETEYAIRILSNCDFDSGNRIEWSHNELSKDIIVGGKGGFLRIPSKIHNYYKEIRRDKSLTNYPIAIAYEMHLPYLFVLKKLKRRNKNLKTVLICPDLSIFMDINKKSIVKSILKKIEKFLFNKLLKYVDGYVLFTAEMKNYFKKYSKPFTIIEGVYRDKFPLISIPKKRYLLYAGSLHDNTGIKELIDSMNYWEDKELELHIYGLGIMSDYIKDKSKINKRIVYGGFVNPSKLFELEKEAMLIVNVRSPLEEYTKYSFPSKNFEFMASGTPLLMTNLIGIPKEYKEYCIIIDDNNPKTIANGVNYICKMTNEERETIGKKAQKYIYENKNKYKQAQKLIELLEQL